MQVHGGVGQGVGVALLEEVVYDETGQNLTASLVDYTPPSATEIPAMDVSSAIILFSTSNEQISDQ